MTKEIHSKEFLRALYIPIRYVPRKDFDMNEPMYADMVRMMPDIEGILIALAYTYCYY